MTSPWYCWNNAAEGTRQVFWNNFVLWSRDNYCKCKSIIFRLMLGIEFLSTSCEVDFRWMPLNIFDDKSTLVYVMALQWHHDERDGVSNHLCLDCLPNRLFRRRSNKKNQNPASLAFVREIHRWSVDSPHKGPVTREMFIFDNIIMVCAVREQTIMSPCGVTWPQWVDIATWRLLDICDHSDTFETTTVVYYWLIIHEYFFEDHGIMSEEILCIDVSLLRKLDWLAWQKVIYSAFEVI